ncbi:hypothetical protein H696_01529 [Fonticula alba]|uniref:UBC core domain-containing protein n=1 Tax=Fonticula alba TaxID=691883 RepID=A0A058ZDX0_FONAL|nr:hypothetical protein H696_01529 [Fonticula alba]KCV72123.1 hypothetical protein H696_01529 [Fonticula alba]|eukprot:XP_009493701.1 hypothetical protein H696_01529 [Fonticula alba]
MSSHMAVTHLQNEFRRFLKNPVPFCLASPQASNFLEWDYCLIGPPDSPYFGGVYHGKIVFPNNFPFSPPSILMITPSGRFETNTRLCLSMSDFHPKTWSASWTVSSILLGIQSFMLEETPTQGSIHPPTSFLERRKLAAASHSHCLSNPRFCSQFPQVKSDIQSGRLPPVDMSPAALKELEQKCLALLSLPKKTAGSASASALPPAAAESQPSQEAEEQPPVAEPGDDVPTSSSPTSSAPSASTGHVDTGVSSTVAPAQTPTTTTSRTKPKISAAALLKQKGRSI